MLLINPQGEYPRHQGDLELEHKDWKPGDVLPEGWILVEATEPNKDPKFMWFEEYPELIDGIYYQKFRYEADPNYVEQPEPLEIEGELVEPEA